MLHVKTDSQAAPRRTGPKSATRIDVRIVADLRPDQSRELIRRTIRRALERAAGKILLPRRTVAVDVLVTDNAEIRRLNAKHRRMDRATDALSFPQYESSEIRFLWGVNPPACFCPHPQGKKDAGKAAPAAITPGSSPIHLGDIVVSLPMIERQSARRDTTLHEELEFAVVHSLLHLLGCDHDTPARRKVMWDYTHLLLWDGHRR